MLFRSLRLEHLHASLAYRRSRHLLLFLRCRRAVVDGCGHLVAEGEDIVDDPAQLADVAGEDVDEPAVVVVERRPCGKFVERSLDEYSGVRSW